MIIYEDTRNQLNKHERLNADLEAHGCKVIRQALNVGDYTLPTDQRICIDTKKDILELLNNIFQDHERFRAECLRALQLGILLIVLTEERPPENRIDKWIAPKFKSDQYTDKDGQRVLVHKKGDPKSIANMDVARKVLITMQERYGVRFMFCDKDQTAGYILELLNGESRQKYIKLLNERSINYDEASKRNGKKS